MSSKKASSEKIRRMYRIASIILFAFSIVTGILAVYAIYIRFFI